MASIEGSSSLTWTMLSNTSFAAKLHKNFCAIFKSKVNLIFIKMFSKFLSFFWLENWEVSNLCQIYAKFEILTTFFFDSKSDKMFFWLLLHLSLIWQINWHHERSLSTFTADSLGLCRIEFFGRQSRFFLINLLFSFYFALLWFILQVTLFYPFLIKDMNC